MQLTSAPWELKRFWELSIKEQRESLQQANPDGLAWVFDYIHTLTENEDLQLTCLENVLCCYPNQLQDGQIKLPEDFWEGNIVIVNMWALRKWNIEVISGNSENLPKFSTPVLLSPGVIEYYEKDWKKYTQTVLRDGWQSNTSAWVKWLADANERTTTAGRNFSGNLWEDLEIENAEESPFLMQNTEWNYVLVSNKPEYKQALKASIQNYLQKKYLTSGNPNFETVKQAFEIKFKWVRYEELWNILRAIIQNDRFDFYNAEGGQIEWLQSTHIKLWEQEGDFYVYIDSANNTIEYRAIRRITWFPEWLTPVGKIPLRLFLESQNQDPSFKKIENIWKYGAWEAKLVPTIRDVKEKVLAQI